MNYWMMKSFSKFCEKELVETVNLRRIDKEGTFNRPFSSF
jgi:hypothetical protein